MRTLPSRRARLLLPAALITALALSGCAPTAQTEPAADASTHPVTHARGTSEVPTNPARVVTLEPVELDTAVALGVTPVGAAVASNVAGIPAYLGVEGVTPVGTVPEPDLEAIAALKPDLILGTESRHAKLYDQLNAIAPTVFMQTQADPWQQNVRLIGEALGKEAQTQELLDAFTARCDEIKQAHPVSGKTANMIRPRDETTLSLYGPTSFAGSALECVGLTIPPQDWQDGLQADISPENVLSARADYVFVTTTKPGDASTLPAAIASNASAFPSLTLVDTSYWVSGVGPKGGSLVLDDIERVLAAK
ncbi:ABC transporter substrate-binding protein [Microbacterium sp. SORGH_AS_0888]|uniref:ABC transporter substrate-binding protein n=1 Tax=Microbacterium sp. SORGH_AS_0888 TaxID=3041791 RepID=UPI0027845247|nr:iron-siderophore ABC transporter substrate-binding protein [Microbacterium sp. SORGH_AS_0888]MDQ1128143.1 iron complex transport system substrate-binding protein [Microbacterium sp. SORGH_AS_0888]